MNKYKVNYIFNEDKDIESIFVKVLSKELKKYIDTYYDFKKRNVLSYANQEDGME